VEICGKSSGTEVAPCGILLTHKKEAHMDTPDWETLRREPLVASEEVAEYLKVTRQTVQRWTRTGEDPLPVRKCGYRGFRRYRMSEVIGWLERRKQM
jgi:excisionase family DNA binding protein